MEKTNELTVMKPEKRTGAVKLSRRMSKLMNTALDTLEDILTDDGVKAADRISAAKLAIETVNRHEGKQEPEVSGPIRVIFDGAPAEWGD